MPFDRDALRHLIRACHAAEFVAVDGWTPAACSIAGDGALMLASPALARPHGDDLSLRLHLPGTADVLSISGSTRARAAGALRCARDQRYLEALGVDAVAAAYLDQAHCSLRTAAAAATTVAWSDLGFEPAFAPAVEARMVDHMNADHLDALVAYCAHAGVACAMRPPSLIGLDADGFDLLADPGLVRFRFEHPCPTPLAVRQALVALAARARGTAS